MVPANNCSLTYLGTCLSQHFRADLLSAHIAPNAFKFDLHGGLVCSKRIEVKINFLNDMLPLFTNVYVGILVQHVLPLWWSVVHWQSGKGTEKYRTCSVTKRDSCLLKHVGEGTVHMLHLQFSYNATSSTNFTPPFYYPKLSLPLSIKSTLTFITTKSNHSYVKVLHLHPQMLFSNSHSHI